jgi:predicted nucleic acid-binding protein
VARRCATLEEPSSFPRKWRRHHSALRFRWVASARGPRAAFELLREHVRAFPDLSLETADYEAAASAFNRCRDRGIQGSNTDFLICATALRRNLSIFTTDGDFQFYTRVLRLKLHKLRG